LLLYQPFYIGGIQDLQTAKDSAFGAMFVFVGTFILSLILWFRDSRVKRRQLLLARHAYDQVPANDSAMENYEVNFDLPESVTDHAASSGLRSRRSSGRLEEENVVTEEELESSRPHVPEGQLLPTTHV